VDRWALLWVVVIKDGADLQIKVVMDMDLKVDIKDGAHRGSGEATEEDQELIMAMVIKCMVIK
jgi:hypothetical protein